MRGLGKGGGFWVRSWVLRSCEGRVYKSGLWGGSGGAVFQSSDGSRECEWGWGLLQEEEHKGRRKVGDFGLHKGQGQVSRTGMSGFRGLGERVEN